MFRQATTNSADETVALGRALASQLTPPLMILLRGDLGAGKTTLVKGIAEGLEAASADDVTSPTFTLVHEYRGSRATVYHIDLYRVDTERELVTLGLDDLVTPTSILLIEWGEKFERFVRQRNLEVVLERTGENKRHIQIRDHSPTPASNGLMSPSRGSDLRKVDSDDLKVGQFCADRDGNRVRIDRVDRAAGRVTYHFLNDELRVQEGVQVRPIEDFLAEVWYLP